MSEQPWSRIPISPESVVGRVLLRTPKRGTRLWWALRFRMWTCRIIGHRWEADPDGAGDYCVRCGRWEGE